MLYYFATDLDEKINIFGRMSSFVPINIGLCAWLLVPNPSMFTIIASQWTNQSYNVFLNHSNRNASKPMSMEQIGKAYAAAVTSSVGIAVGLSQLLKRSSLPAKTKATIGMFLPFFSVSGAGIVNVFAMRSSEIQRGITVVDENGDPHGESKKAGLTAVGQVATSRVVNVFGILTLPTLAMSVLEKTKFVQSRPRLHAPLNLFCIGTALAVALPMTIGIFPQVATLHKDQLEPEFQNCKDKDGNPVDTFYFNRGL